MPRLMFCHDIVCLTETWLTEYHAELVVPHFTCYSATRFIRGETSVNARDAPGRHSRGVSEFQTDCMHVLSLSRPLARCLQRGITLLLQAHF